MNRTATAILSTDNLHHNIDVLKQKARGAKIMAMIKANGYGHGLRSISRRLQGYADILGVARIDEAQALRQAGITLPIALMEGVFEPTELLYAAVNNFHCIIHNEQQLKWFLSAELPKPLNLWIKIDTGLNRLGFTPAEGISLYQTLHQHPHCVKPLHILSHFACADQADHPLNTAQIQNFSMVRHAMGDQCLYSFCNSAGVFHYPGQAYDYVRPGLALYGVSPIKGINAYDLGLKPVMTVQSCLISIKQCVAGDYVGYGARYQCPCDMTIGIVAFGYGDGYPLTARDGTPVLIQGIRCPLVGRVSMDMMAVDLTPLLQAAKTPDIGDTVVLWGHDLPLEEITSYTQNLSYDILTGVQNRVRFLWM